MSRDVAAVDTLKRALFSCLLNPKQKAICVRLLAHPISACLLDVMTCSKRIGCCGLAVSSQSRFTRGPQNLMESEGSKAAYYSGLRVS